MAKQPRRGNPSLRCSKSLNKSEARMFSRRIAFMACLVPWVRTLHAQPEVPAWCRSLPRQEYKTLQYVPVHDAWFEVYRVTPGVFAIYEPHQSEETISYL